MKLQIQNEKVDCTGIELFSYLAIYTPNDRSKYKADRIFLANFKDQKADANRIEEGQILELAVTTHWDFIYRKYMSRKELYLVLAVGSAEIDLLKVDSAKKILKIKEARNRILNYITHTNWKTANQKQFFSENSGNLAVKDIYREDCNCELCGTAVKTVAILTDGANEHKSGLDCAIKFATRSLKEYVAVDEVIKKYESLKRKEKAAEKAAA